MRARRIIEAGAFDPAGVDRLQQAFEMAWENVVPLVDRGEHERLREALARIVVAMGNVSGLDADELAAAATRSFLAVRAADAS